MTMFKTPQEIEEMAEKEFPTIMWSNAMIACATRDKQDGYKKGYTQAQKDLLESASEGFEDFRKSLHELESEEFDLFSGLKAWQAAKFSSKSQIDTLKQRELEYQGDLRGKDRIINEKSNQIIEITKELQEKDEEIKFLKASNAKLEEARVAHLTSCEEKDAEIERLKRIICKCDTSVGFICNSCHDQKYAMTKEEFITIRTKIICEMIENPNEIGIYPTTKAFAQLDDLYDKMNVHSYGDSDAQKQIKEILGVEND